MFEEMIQQFMLAEKQKKVRCFKELNRYVKKGQTVFAGSSLMEQFPIEEMQISHDIPCVIYNRGIGGFVCEELEKVLDECVFELEPSRVFLNIGTNDLNDTECTDEVLVERYRRIVMKILNRLPSVELILMAYYPVNPEAAPNEDMRKTLEIRSNERIKSATAAVKNMAEELDVKFIDVNKGLYDDNGCLKAEYTVEGMHIYPSGYEAVLEELLPYLVKA